MQGLYTLPSQALRLPSGAKLKLFNFDMWCHTIITATVTCPRQGGILVGLPRGLSSWEGEP